MIKMTKDKEQAKDDYMEVISHSWTWERLTITEQDRFSDIVSQQKLAGTYQQRHDTIHAMYSAFLAALEYEPSGWREVKRKG
jgi:hypothetical protein